MKKQLPYFILAFLLPVIAMLWWWGLFSATTVTVEQTGPYRYAYLEAIGPYSKLAGVQEEVLANLKQQGIPAGTGITLLQSDPRTSKSDQLHAQTGFLVTQSAKPTDPLRVAEIPARQAAVATIKAHPLLAYGKAYGALLAYVEEHHQTLRLPTLEKYEHSVLQVEMPLH